MGAKRFFEKPMSVQNTSSKRVLSSSDVCIELMNKENLVVSLLLTAPPLIVDVNGTCRDWERQWK